LNKRISRRGNTHEFFCPVSVYRTSNGFVYIAVGNDRQWKSMVAQYMFKSLDRPAYEKNQGRIADVEALNRSINEITKNHTSEELIELFCSITIPISKIKTIPEVIADDLVHRKLLFSKDPDTKTEITLPPPPNMTSFLEKRQRQLSFPPRFGEHNQEIYGKLGYSAEDLGTLKEKGII
jgi:formyl-CoA transferase